MIASYKDLIVWQKSIILVKEVYKLTSTFPKDELYGLVSQMRRAAVTIPSNIAEGFGRKSHKEQNQFYLIAFSSALELETQIIIAKELKFLDVQKSLLLDPILLEVIKMLNKMTILSR